MSAPDFFLIWPMTDSPALPDWGWWELIKSSVEYPCAHPIPRTKIDPVRIVGEGQSASLSFVARVPCSLIHKDLRLALSPEVDAHFAFGAVIHAAKGELDDIQSYWPQHLAWLRGGPQSYCYRCADCGQIVYLPRGNWSLVEANIPRTPLFATHYGAGIVAARHIAERLKERRWKKLSISPLSVLPAPRDGFPVDLNSLTKEQERRLPHHQPTATLAAALAAARASQEQERRLPHQQG